MEINAEKTLVGEVLFSKQYNCKITVEAITTTGLIVCVWIDPNGLPHRELQKPTNLKKA